jgi:hypothetical protein
MFKYLECRSREKYRVSVQSFPLVGESLFRPQSRQDYPLNLSILISGGKETNKDFLSNGERKGKSSALNLASHGCHDMWRLGRIIACTR